uniref:Proline iminopeptidase n=1 Tax=Rhizochromulina marina TaxID=1034831 RepID=A0A7S2SM31_9STRA|mmetsp:Transcript_31849/g.92529  ORF Transcript_31849/g.92529 Transcript_31849/m.92529 type:complete len:372 (+) Transcript_31849:22-1137(+)|eukprot:CAMPEP_0118973940 /NCGR_PEP_ID=MMETSP1173-20130426/10989_1 /TAXON_ID=1034831 /ORGANISM="Rhizochromulina marina cf, Strain CCMP1243" /LENGTH=371 /DNA_ID=CAMNT_0006923639 /DNA_START=24 /DNA_END=1139 /DNA_ORIENTATION=+
MASGGGAAENGGFKPLEKTQSFAEGAGAPALRRQLYPDVEPYQTGFLPVGDHSHQLYFDVSGNPDGAPALFLHGGPGGGCGAHVRRFFDPNFYRIVCFDQRGCHRSKPNAADDWEAAIAGNNTQELVDDCEALRQHLGVDRWHVVLGGSWGSTLALAYAQAHPSAMGGLILRGVFLFSPHEIDYLFQSGEVFGHHPEAWEGYRDHIRESCETPAEWETERQNLLGAYYRRLCSKDPKVAEAAAKAFIRFELSISKTFPDSTKLEHVLSTPTILIPFALFEAHFMLNNGFLRRGELLDNVVKMKDMHVRIAHGRCDYVCRPEAAYRLYKALLPHMATQDQLRLEMVSGAGHSDSEPGLIDALVRATDEFREF